MCKEIIKILLRDRKDIVMLNVIAKRSLSDCKEVTNRS